MNSPEKIKIAVKDAYTDIARSRSSCCGKSPEETLGMYEAYDSIPGYASEADLGLGCGVPTAFAGIREGMTVLDLGSGAGSDIFIAAQAVGHTGRAIGIDMTPEMVARAEENRKKLGLPQVEFRLGEIESLPVDSSSVDLVISNCVLNLVPDKRQAFSEMYRVLKPGGHFTVSDIVLEGTLGATLRRSAAAWASCVAGAMQMDDYIGIAAQTGFSGLIVEKEKIVPLPDDWSAAIALASGVSVTIKSITLTGFKPEVESPHRMRRARKEDIDAIRSLLGIVRLPDIELEKHVDHFILVETGGKLLACGGVEIHGEYGLVRSVAVDPPHQRKGFGAKLYGALETDARMYFLKELFLFTNDAAGFFLNQGYAETERSAIPLPIRDSEEFGLDCCAHSVVMRKRLSQDTADEFKLANLPILPTSCC